jgi:uncharacterized membrane protein (UPF0127 family)
MDPPRSLIELRAGTGRLCVEIADEPAELSRGLMHRPSMPDDHGMLFVFPDEQPRSFWMKNTHIPLSIAYADAERRVVSILDMRPLDLSPVLSGARAMYALEVNKGWFQRHRLSPGDLLEFELP